MLPREARPWQGFQAGNATNFRRALQATVPRLHRSGRSGRLPHRAARKDGSGSQGQGASELCDPTDPLALNG